MSWLFVFLWMAVGLCGANVCPCERPQLCEQIRGQRDFEVTRNLHFLDKQKSRRFTNRFSGSIKMMCAYLYNYDRIIYIVIAFRPYVYTTKIKKTRGEL